MTAIERVVKRASNEIGYLEKKSNSQLYDDTANAGYNNWTKYANDLDKLGVYNGKKNGFDWCDMFVDWVFITEFGVNLGMKLLCQPMGGLGAGCTYSMQYYKNKGQLHTQPKPGDQIFFSRDGWKTSYHTGIVVDVKGSTVYTIEGNTSSASGVIANGGCVARKSYPVGSGRYGRPNYSIVEEEEEMSYERFVEYLERYLDEVADEKPGSWSKASRAWAEQKGLIRGDETGNKRYKSDLTREEFVEVLYRFSQLK